MSSEPRLIEGHFDAQGRRFLILVARFNHLITDRLLEGALDGLRRHGADLGQVRVVKVPGCFEMPSALQMALQAETADAVVCLGAVIRGSTPHFDYVAGECAKGVAQVSLSTGVPVAFGVLTTDTIEQALERAGTKAGNKGFESAQSAVEMADLRARLQAP